MGETVPEVLSSNVHQASGKLMTKPVSPSPVENRYDGPLLTDTLQYFFVTDLVRPRNVEALTSTSLRSTIRLHTEEYSSETYIVIHFFM